MMSFPNPDTPDVRVEVPVHKFKRISYTPDGSFNLHDLSVPERNAIHGDFLHVLTTFVEFNSSVQSDDESFAESNAQTYTTELFLKPPDRYSEIYVKEGTPFKNFAKRKFSGEILMSNYDRATISVTQKPGLATSRMSNSRANLRFSSFVERRIVTVIPDWGFVYKDVLFLADTGPTAIAGSYMRSQVDSSEWVFDSPLTGEMVYNATLTHESVVTDLVTRTLAKANRRSVDVLTAFAEMPKSVASLFAGFKLVAGMLKDFKTKKFSLTKAHAARTSRNTKRYQARMRRFESELANTNLSSSRRKILEAQYRREHMSFSKLMSDSSKELANALANLWLNYRYNIMPNVYLAQDIYEAFDKFEREWITSRDFQSSTETLRVDSYLINAKVKDSIVIKRNFTPAQASRGVSVISNSLPVTAWELIPLSFVYDWFINFGELIASKTYNFQGNQEGTTLATKISLDAHVSDHPNLIYLYEPITIVKGACYKRRVINPENYCGLVWQPSVGLERKIDALALIWRPVRSLLEEGKRR